MYSEPLTHLCTVKCKKAGVLFYLTDCILKLLCYCSFPSTLQFSSVQFGRSVVSESLRPHGPQLFFEDAVLESQGPTHCPPVGL